MTLSSEVVPGPALLEEGVRLATLAPSVHNTQPWLFRITRGGVDVLIDRGRRLDVVDPQGREQHISLGAAICNLRVALSARTFQPVVRLLPAPDQPDLVAHVSAAGSRRVSSHDRALRGAIANRRTSRLPFSGRPLEPTVLRALEVAAAAEYARLTILDHGDAAGLLALVRTAEARLRHDESYRAEIGRWTTDDPHRLDGVPTRSFGPASKQESLPVRDFGVVRATDRRRVEQFEAEPTIAVVATVGDDRVDWLQAGVALQRVLLEATVAGIATSCMSQPLQVPPLRELYDGSKSVATQMILRLGYAPQSPATPRRPVGQVLLQGRAPQG